VARARKWIWDQLQRAARPERSTALRAYLGSPVPVLSVAAPEVHRIVARFRNEFGPPPWAQLELLLRRLWAGPTYDERIVAIELLDRYAEPRVGGPWRLADSWVDRATGWALSDSLAAGPIARIVAEDTPRFSELLRWTRSPNLWRRRAATYALHDLVRDGDLDRPFALLERLRADPEFWVQRAVGTWLRECWKKDPRRTERFLLRHVRVLAPVTITVATERAPSQVRGELRRLSRESSAYLSGRSEVGRRRAPERLPPT
jgi:3-methyladenine DNA glycosylase AlkD